MAAGEVLVDSLIEWGSGNCFSLPETVLTESWSRCVAATEDPIHPGSARRVGRVHGLRLREVHGKTGCVWLLRDQAAYIC
jgi:hypothetical protein